MDAYEDKPQNQAVDPLGSLADFRQLQRLEATVSALIGRGVQMRALRARQMRSRFQITDGTSSLRRVCQIHRRSLL